MATHHINENSDLPAEKKSPKGSSPLEDCSTKVKVNSAQLIIMNSPSNEQKCSEVSQQLQNDMTRMKAALQHVKVNSDESVKQKCSISTKRPLKSQENTAPAKRCKSERKPNPSVRFNCTHGHLPQIDKSKSVRCKNEGCQKRTYILCSTCNIHLCVCVNENRNCFAEFHTINPNDK